MMVIYYKSFRFIDGVPKWIIEDEFGNINKNPTREELKLTISGSFPKTCCICGNNKGKMYRHYDDNKIWDYKYICSSCYENLKIYGILDRRQIEDNKKMYLKKKSDIYFGHRVCCMCGGDKTHINTNDRPVWFNYSCGTLECKGYICKKCYEINDSGSNANRIKLTTKSRNSDLSMDVSLGKGTIGETIVAKVRKLDVLSVKLDNFHSAFDLSHDSELGIIQVKSPTINRIKRTWSTDIGQNIFDNIFLLCMCESRKNVRRVYIIPAYVLCAKSTRTVTITENPSYGGWYEKYRIDEKPYDDAYQNLMLYFNVVRSPPRSRGGLPEETDVTHK